MFISLSLVCALAAAPAARASDSSVREVLLREYKQGAAAFLRRDVDALMNMATADVTSRRLDGKTWDRKQIRVYLNLSTGVLKTIEKAEFKLRKLSPDSGKVVAEVDRRVEGTMGGGQAAKPHKLVNISVQRDTWVKVGKEWKIRYNEVVRESTILDGKRMDATPPRGGPSHK